MAKNFFQRIKLGLRRAHQGFVGKIDGIFARALKIDDDLFEELEAVLIESDVGPAMSRRILEDLRIKVKEKKIRTTDALKELLKAEMASLFCAPREWNFRQNGPTVILVIGVNGVGKTTTIAKMTRHFLDNKKSVLLAAGDTFRAAAVDQLKIWAGRLGVDCVAYQEGADAAAVCFDAVTAAKARGVDVLIVDTAGRLHTKSHLIEELKKVKRTIQKIIPEAPHEILLVLDATTGQNGLFQAQVFSSEMASTGIALTKLDGTAKGGIALTVSKELSLPIRFIGIGEKVEDLVEFNASEFVEALFAD